MTDTLTIEKIAEVERIVSEQAAGVSPYSDETDCLIWAALPSLIAMAKRSIELEAIKNSLLKDWSQNSLHGRLQLLGRAEEAETDAASLRIQIEAMTQINLALAQQFVADRVRLRAALAFYADPSDYKAPFTGGLGKLWSDCGSVARAALEGETRHG